MKRPRTAALLTGLIAALVMSACGVPPSGVIEAGDPATGMAPGLNLYFLSPGGKLVTVPRAAAGGADIGTALRLLFAGPTPDEALRVSTRLPRLTTAPQVKAYGDLVAIRLPGVSRLSKPALEQLVCTTVRAWHAQPGNLPGLLPGNPRAAAPGTAPPATDTSVPVPTAAQPVNVLVSGAGWMLPRTAADCP